MVYGKFSSSLVAITTYIFHWLLVGKSGNWQYFSLTFNGEKWKLAILLKVEIGNIAVSLQLCICFFLEKCFRSSSLWVLWIWSKLLNLIGCHGNINGNFLKKILKICFSDGINGMKLIHCIQVHDISLYMSCVSYCCCPWGYIGIAA